MLILGIESSCDETAAAVVKDVRSYPPDNGFPLTGKQTVEARRRFLATA